MRKCPNCAEEDINGGLFCKNCGRCLLSPDPKEVQRPTATHPEHYITPEGIDFYDAHRIKKSSVARLKMRHQTEPSAIVGLVLVLNLLVFILMAEVARYIISLSDKV